MMIKSELKQGSFTDEELIRKVKEGEVSFFEDLIRSYNSLLYKIARSYGLNHQDAEDIMQETHFAAYTELKNFRGDASYKTWITKILLHKCYHKISYGSLKYEIPAFDIASGNESVLYASMSKTETEKMVINKELANVLEQSIRKLPLPYREVFVLREIENFSISETAELLNITASNVKVRLSRAKVMLQNQIAHFYSSVELFEFNLVYCDKIVQRVFDNIYASGGGK